MYLFLTKNRSMKRFVIIIASVCLSMTSFAQIDFKLGVKGGLNMSKINGGSPVPSSLIEYKSLTSGHFGVLARLKLLGMVAVQPEVLYSMQGTTKEITILGITTTKDVKTDYVQVPVMIKYYPLLGFNLQAGPQVGFLTKAQDGDDDVKDDYNSTYYAVNMGLGWDLPFGLGVDARYSMGVSDVVKDFKGDKKDNRMNMFTVALSYCF